MSVKMLLNSSCWQKRISNDCRKNKNKEHTALTAAKQTAEKSTERSVIKNGQFYARNKKGKFERECIGNIFIAFFLKLL